MGKPKKIKFAQNVSSPGKKSATFPVRRQGSLPWLIGIFIFIGVAIAASVILYGRYQAQIFQAAILSNAATVTDSLSANRGKFTFEQTRQLNDILRRVQITAGQAPLDKRSAGQLKFILAVVGEIVQGGNVLDEEIRKLQAQIDLVQYYLKQIQRQNPKP